MNSAHLNTAIYEISLNIGTSLNLKKVINDAVSSYLRQLDCTGIVLLEKNNCKYHIHTAKPRILKKSIDLQYVLKRFFDKIDNLEDEYFKSKETFETAYKDDYYYFYKLQGFGVMLFIKNDKPFEIETIKALSQINNKFANSIVACIEIEKLREKEKLLYQQSKMASMGEMIGNIAHQWRQPLSGISSIATGLKLEYELGIFNEEEMLSKLDIINNKAQYLSQTIEDFRDFFKPTNTKEVFDIEDVVNESVSIVGSSLKNNDINIILNLKSSIVNGNINEFKQAIINIINNAKDALMANNHNERLVFINLFNQNDEIILEILDNAGGVPDDIADKIFEPYFTTKHKSQGTGIGLYMTKEIIEKHSNSRVSFENKEYLHKGKSYKGASFSIIIKNKFM